MGCRGIIANSTSCRDYDIGQVLDDAKSRYLDPRTILALPLSSRVDGNRRYRWMMWQPESVASCALHCSGVADTGMVEEQKEDVLRWK